jgi:hypothetical protein
MKKWIFEILLISPLYTPLLRNYELDMDVSLHFIQEQLKYFHKVLLNLKNSSPNHI